jgi:hypothetical protein
LDGVGGERSSGRGSALQSRVALRFSLFALRQIAAKQSIIDVSYQLSTVSYHLKDKEPRLRGNSQSRRHSALAKSEKRMAKSE